MTNNYSLADNIEERLTNKQVRLLVKNYKIALKEIKSSIATGFEQYGGDWVEMNKYNRLLMLEKSITEEIRKLTAKNAVNMISGTKNTYMESYYVTGYVLESDLGVKLGFGLLDPVAVTKAIQNPLDRVGFLQRNRDNQAKMTKQLLETLTQGLIKGDSYHTIAKAVTKNMEVGASNAERIVRTENHRVLLQARLDGMGKAEKKGIDIKKQWSSARDERTRAAHKQLNGVTIPLNALFQSSTGARGMGPGQMGSTADDINCRCSLVSIVDDYEPKTTSEKFVNYEGWYKDRIQ